MKYVQTKTPYRDQCVVLVFLLLTFNIFHTFSLELSLGLWASKCLLSIFCFLPIPFCYLEYFSFCIFYLFCNCYFFSNTCTKIIIMCLRFYAKIKYYNHLCNYFTKILEWELDPTLNITMITSQHDGSKAII